MSPRSTENTDLASFWIEKKQAFLSLLPDKNNLLLLENQVVDMECLIDSGLSETQLKQFGSSIGITDEYLCLIKSLINYAISQQVIEEQNVSELCKKINTLKDRAELTSEKKAHQLNSYDNSETKIANCSINEKKISVMFKKLEEKNKSILMLFNSNTSVLLEQKLIHQPINYLLKGFTPEDLEKYNDIKCQSHEKDSLAVSKLKISCARWLEKNHASLIQISIILQIIEPIKNLFFHIATSGGEKHNFELLNYLQQIGCPKNKISAQNKAINQLCDIIHDNFAYLETITNKAKRATHVRSRSRSLGQAPQPSQSDDSSAGTSSPTAIPTRSRTASQASTHIKLPLSLSPRNLFHLISPRKNSAAEKTSSDSTPLETKNTF